VNLRAVVLVLVIGGSVFGDLCITLSDDGSGGTQIQLSGMGTEGGAGTGSGAGSILNFDNLVGDPFLGSIFSGSTTIFFLGSSLALSSSISIDDIRIENDGSNLSDFDLVASSSTTGASYDASGTATIFTDSALTMALPFSNFVAGTYAATSGDADNFGGVTLKILESQAIPEASQYALMGLFASLVGGLRILSKEGWLGRIAQRRNSNCRPV